MSRTRVARLAFDLQLTSFRRAPLTVVFVVLLPLNLLLLTSLFALTGYHIPTGLVMEEDTPLARAFADALADAHNSYKLEEMSFDEGVEQLKDARIGAVIVIPEGFDATIKSGRTAPVQLLLDNVNLDIAEDARRAIPAAASIFAAREGFQDVRLVPRLRNVLPRDTGYVEYLGVAAIALSAVLAGAILGATVIARDHELDASPLTRLTTTGPGPLLAGRLAAATLVGLIAVAATPAVVVWGYGVPIKHPFEAALGIVATLAAATALGGLVGAWLKKTMVAVPLILGVAIAFYLDSGAVEPQRFDGEFLFWLAHLSPTYWGVGIMEHAFHGLTVTPEPVALLIAVLFAFAIAGFALLPRAVRSL